MNKFILIFFCMLITSCKASESFTSVFKPQFETVFFGVVQKQLIVDQELPNHVQKLLFQWFDHKVKIDGFDGDVKITVSNFSQDISSINDGKRVDISMSFEVVLNNPSLSQKKFIEGNISSYGTLTGNFSLNEFDNVIQNTQSDLILRLSKDLKSKI